MPAPVPADRAAAAGAARAARLELALVELLAGEPATPDPLAAVVQRYPDLADELRDFWRAHQQLRAAAAPVRAALDAAAGGDAEATEPWSRADSRRTDERPADDSTPRSVGEYELLAELGRGGMGIVFRARHRRLGRVVALKMIPGGQFAGAEELQRFRAEARAAAALTHPGIVPLFEAGEFDGAPFLAMALIEGVSLAERIRQGPLPCDEAAHLLRKIAAAVAYAHQQGVIHRDLKPGNILLERTACGGSSSAGLPAAGATAGAAAWEPRITDFGLAKQLASDETNTATGRVLGTPAYMPPEQAAGKQALVRETADIYSLGALLFAMLTGRPPFVAASPVDVLLQVLESEPPQPSSLRRDVPRELEWICLKCLEKNPAARYDSAAALVADLQRYLLREPPLARAPDAFRRLRTWIRREPVLAWHVLAIGALLLLVQGIFLAHPLSEWAYHLRVSGVLGVWLAGAVVFHSLRRSFRDSAVGCALWIALDLGCLTALLAQLAGPLGALTVGYPLLILGSGLFFRPRYVAGATVAALAANLLLFVLRPEEAPPWHYLLLFQTLLVVTGLCTGYLVWRLQVLSAFYNDQLGGRASP